MNKSYRTWIPRQTFLLPPSPSDWLASNHFVYFILDLVEELDLRAIEDAIQERDARGNRPFDPQMMTALLLYGYSQGIASSRKLEKATYEDIGFRVLAAGLHPDHTAISEFRRVHLSALQQLFLQVLRLCVEAGIVDLAHVALDGTKVRANANRDGLSYSTIVEEEKRLAAEVERIFKDAERIDREEDEKQGKDKRGGELPEGLRTRQDRLKKIREAKKKLEAEAAKTRANELRALERHVREKAERATSAKARQRETTHAEYISTCISTMDAKAAELSATIPPTPLPMHRTPAETTGDPKPLAETSLTDPDSRVMKSNGAFLRGYNCQAAVDGKNQVIVAQAVTNHPNDHGSLVPMLDLVEANVGSLPTILTADGGYWSPESAAHCRSKNVDAYIPLADSRRKPGKRPFPGEDERAAMRTRLQSPDAKTIYRRRAAVVEPIFGQIKDTRGFRRLLLRGITKVTGEWSLITTTHNLLKLFRAKRMKKLALAT